MPINYCHYYKTAEHVPQIAMIIIRCIIRITRIMRVFHLLFHGDAMQRRVWDQADPIRCIKREREREREKERCEAISYIRVLNARCSLFAN